MRFRRDVRESAAFFDIRRKSIRFLRSQPGTSRPPFEQFADRVLGRLHRHHSCYRLAVVGQQCGFAEAAGAIHRLAQVCGGLIES